MENEILSYVMRDALECNLSYMPFINDGGLFVPTTNQYSLGDNVVVELQLPGNSAPIRIEGKVIWITPRNALHHVLPGIGIQFTGEHAKDIKGMVESHLDPKNEIGGYTYGVTEK